MEALSSSESVPFWYCTASSRVRWSIECTSCSEPSAVWTSETASCALRSAWPSPRTWPRSRSLIDRPAASSAARLIREPDDSFSIDFESFELVAIRFRWALNASMLLLMRSAICFLLDATLGTRHLRRLGTCRCFVLLLHGSPDLLAEHGQVAWGVHAQPDRVAGDLEDVQDDVVPEHDLL